MTIKYFAFLIYTFSLSIYIHIYILDFFHSGKSSYIRGGPPGGAAGPRLVLPRFGCFGLPGTIPRIRGFGLRVPADSMRGGPVFFWALFPGLLSRLYGRRDIGRKKNMSFWAFGNARAHYE